MSKISFKIKNNKTFKKINLSCSQILKLNIILGKSSKIIQTNRFNKFLLLSYNDTNIFNYYWIFNILKKYILFLVNIHIKQNHIAIFSTQFNQPVKEHSHIHIIIREGWVKGLLSNKYMLYWVPELWEIRIPNFFLILNSNEDEIDAQFGEFIRRFLPSLFVLEKATTKYKVDQILYLLPGNIKSLSFATWLYKLVFLTNFHSRNLIKKNIFNFLK